MRRVTKKLFLVKDLPIFIEANDEMQALMMFEEAALKVQSKGFDGIIEVDTEDSHQKSLDQRYLN